MIKFFLYFLLLFLSGCSIGGNINNEHIPDIEREFIYERNNSLSVINNGYSIPIWVKKSSLNFFESVGSAYKSNSGYKFQSTEALAVAKEELRDKIQKSFFLSLKDTLIELNIENNDFLLYATRQVSVQTTSLAEKKELWFSPTQELFILIELASDDFYRVVDENINILLKQYKAIESVYYLKNGKNILKNKLKNQIKK